MIAEKPKGMKYITRMDYTRAHGWQVRIFGKRSYGNGKRYKFFGDAKYESKAKGLREAKKFRDKHFSLLTRAQKTVNHQRELGKTYGGGIYITWRARGKWSYPHVTVSWCENREQYRKSFSVEKYGYDKAMRLAKKMRKEMTKHKVAG